MRTGMSGLGERVAFFGGSFDPPHEGHLAIARAARDALSLDTVLFAPVGAQPLKPNGSAASFEERVAMVKLAIAGEPGFAVSLADAPRPGKAPNYTLETLLELRSELPADCLLFFLIGADSFLGLHGWHRAAEIPFAADLIVASRPGQRLDDPEPALPAGLSILSFSSATEGTETGSGPAVRRYRVVDTAGLCASLFVLAGLNFEVSASEVRDELEKLPGTGALRSGAVPAQVMAYIRAHRLYIRA